MHPRLSVNAICSMNQSLTEDLSLWADLGIDNVGLISPKLAAAGWDDSRQAVLEAGLQVSSMSCYRDGIAESLEFAASVGTPVLYIVAGSAGSRGGRRPPSVLPGAGAVRGAGPRSWVSGSRSSPPIRCEPT